MLSFPQACNNHFIFATLYPKLAAIFISIYVPNYMKLPMVKPFTILIADDDSDDVQLTRDCFDENNLPIRVNDVNDGQLLVEHLKNLVSDANDRALPQLILLDLNMPRKTGLEALQELKADTRLCRIPVIIFSTSKAQKEIDKAYELGASCFVSKPNTLEEWCDKMGKLGRFWLDCVKVSA